MYVSHNGVIHKLVLLCWYMMRDLRLNIVQYTKNSDVTPIINPIIAAASAPTCLVDAERLDELGEHVRRAGVVQDLLAALLRYRQPTNRTEMTVLMCVRTCTYDDVGGATCEGCDA